MIPIQDAVLYGLLVFGSATWLENSGNLDPRMFDGDRRRVFEAIRHLNSSGSLVNVFTAVDHIGDEIEDSDVYDVIMGSFISRSTMAANIKYLHGRRRTVLRRWHRSICYLQYRRLSQHGKNIEAVGVAAYPVTSRASTSSASPGLLGSSPACRRIQIVSANDQADGG